MNLYEIRSFAHDTIKAALSTWRLLWLPDHSRLAGSPSRQSIPLHQQPATYQSPPFEKIAADFDLWQEYIDPDATMLREEFDGMSHGERLAFINENFDPEVPTVEKVLGSCPDRGNDNRGWRTEGGEIVVDAIELEYALERAYDPTMPNWPAMVEIDA